MIQNDMSRKKNETSYCCLDAKIIMVVRKHYFILKTKNDPVPKGLSRLSLLFMC